MTDRIATVSVTGPLVGELTSLRAGFLAAWHSGNYQGERFGFETAELLWSRITPKRLALLHVLQGLGPVSIREAARQAHRDVKSVHGDVHALLDIGLLEKTEEGKIECPFAEIRLDVSLRPIRAA